MSLIRCFRVLVPVLILAVCASVAIAGTVDLSSGAPVDSISAVAPNVVVSFDTSSSTGEESNILNLDSSGNIDTDNLYDYMMYMKFYDPDINTQWYNPNVQYRPAMLPDGTEMPNASYTAAWADGICTNQPATPPTGRTRFPCYQYNNDPGTLNLSNDFGNAISKNAIWINNDVWDNPQKTPRPTATPPSPPPPWYSSSPSPPYPSTPVYWTKYLTGQDGAFYTTQNTGCTNVNNNACFTAHYINSGTAAEQQN